MRRWKTAVLSVSPTVGQACSVTAEHSPSPATTPKVCYNQSNLFSHCRRLTNYGQLGVLQEHWPPPGTTRQWWSLVNPCPGSSFLATFAGSLGVFYTRQANINCYSDTQKKMDWTCIKRWAEWEKDCPGKIKLGRRIHLFGNGLCDGQGWFKVQMCPHKCCVAKSAAQICTQLNPAQESVCSARLLRSNSHHLLLCASMIGRSCGKSPIVAQRQTCD